MEKLTKDQLKELKSVFRIFDKDGNGTIRKKEFQQVFKSMSLMPSEGELKAFLKLVDENRDDCVDFGEFLKFFGEKYAQPVSREELKQAFGYFDRNKSNFLEISELEEVFKKLGIKHTKTSLRNIFYKLDSDKDDSITFQEFCKFFE